ncbi:unnamed protein product [Staurois parvus]|uniref:Uncharacterized protein n=1 Tax=Staurois parvus TaxID=386267 RepID=A0ABN9H2X1_9NEOB|nr:unnamed protein product [Staurois parvus]
MSAVSGHFLYYVRSLWSSPVLCQQSLVICFSGHLLYRVRQSLMVRCVLWSEKYGIYTHK